MSSIIIYTRMMHNTRCIWAGLMYIACVPPSPQYKACVMRWPAKYIACETRCTYTAAPDVHKLRRRCTNTSQNCGDL